MPSLTFVKGQGKLRAAGLLKLLEMRDDSEFSKTNGNGDKAVSFSSRNQYFKPDWSKQRQRVRRRMKRKTHEPKMIARATATMT